MEDVARRWKGEKYIVIATMVAQHQTHLRKVETETQAETEVQEEEE